MTPKVEIFANSSTYYYDKECQYEDCSQAIVWHRFADFRNNTFFFTQELKIEQEGSYFLVLLIAGLFAFLSEFL